MPQPAGDRIVGRSAELGRLAAVLDEAAAGRPSVALIGGDAGVGKTRLVTELERLAASRGFLVLAGRCAELADSVPYLPLADALRTAAGAPDADGRLLDALAARPVLSRLLPDTDGAAETSPGAPGIARQQLFGAVIGMLAELAEFTPVLLVLEDLHWADQSTRDLVTFLTRVLNRERLTVVASYRTDDLHRRHPLRPMIAELSRVPGVLVMPLGPLQADAMAEHLTALAGGMVDAVRLERIIARAEGNAYYAEELLAASATGRDGDLPSGLADLLLARAEQLSASAQQLLRAAAVAGRRVDDHRVTAICGLPAPEYEAAVREAVASQLLVHDGTEGYAFRHALLREAIYADLLPTERTRLHAAMADLLATDGSMPAVPGTAAELARHCLASHDITGAFAASVQAATEAADLAAPAEAHRHLELALSLWDRVPEAAQLAGMQRGALAFRYATLAADSGQFSRALHELRALIGTLPAEADPVLFSQASERLAFLLLDIDQVDNAVAAAQRAVDALAGSPPSATRARALAMHARILLVQADPARARARAEQAQAEARTAQAPGVEADALVTLGMVSERTGDTPAATAQFTAAAGQARAAGDLGTELRAMFQLARICLEQGDLPMAATAAHQGTRRATETGLGLAPYGFDLRYLHYLTHYADGEWDQAQLIADSFPVRVTSVPEARMSAMALFIEVARGSGAVAERFVWLEPYREMDPFTHLIARGLLAEHALWLGATDRAVSEAAAVIQVEYELAKDHHPPVIRVAAIGIGALADRARHARATRDPGAAAEDVAAAADLLDVARQGAAFRAGTGYKLGIEGRGWLARAEAEYLRAAGRNEPDAWRSVVDAFDGGFRYETARSRWRLAEALAEAGDREAAAAQWLLAVRVADELGATRLRSALADLGHRARLAPPDGRHGTAAAGEGMAGGVRSRLGGLTGREREVLTLLVAGRTNKEIAAELFISAKTASVHVSNILAKLRATSRTEAAAIAHAEGIDLPAAPASGTARP